MSQIVFIPGFDGKASLRREFLDALSARHAVRAVSYPNRLLGSLDGYRDHAMSHAPVDWKPILVAESFSGLVGARWAAIDSRVQALVLCGAFARNPVGHAAFLGAVLPTMVKMGPAFMGPMAWATGDERRARWGAGLSKALSELDEDVIGERLRIIASADVGPELTALRIPTVVVHFDSDVVIGSRARSHLESVCHQPVVLRLEGPHFALETRPAECAAAISAVFA
jgi:pimeloyl-[acyl-carrier protein] methyl ester esterase